MRSNVYLAAAIAAGALFAGVGAIVSSQAAENVTLVALVTSSTQVPFDELAAAFSKKHPGVTFDTKFLGGGEVANGVDKGAPVDVVIAGSGPLKKVMGELDDVVNIYNTKDIIITPKKGGKVKSLKDLAGAGIRVSMAAPGSAVGAIASQIVQKYAASQNDFGFVKAVLDNTVKPQPEKESDVVAALEKGQADAAIVFVTDGDPRKFAVVDIPDSDNVISTYIAAVSKNAKNAALGKEFVELLASKEGQNVFAKDRYLPPPPK